ncbi:MAG TPA: DUF4384 domain-containing protein [Blastocatellia bacterium]|nr:DUF4384 domain-containing protein [Blastocatellia bacterium]
MRAMLRFTSVSIALALLISVSISAQEQSGTRARDLFIKKRADAMSIVLLKAEGARFVPTSPNTEFKGGDQIKIAFESNFQGYIYLVNVTPRGRKQVLFPYADSASNVVKPNQRYEFPPGGDIIEFDGKEKGTEVLQVIMSRERIKLLEEAVKNSQGYLGESAASVAAELQNGITGDKVAEVIPETGQGGVRSRNVIIAAGQDKNPQGSVVAIEDTDKPSGGSSSSKIKPATLKPGEIARFELRLKHN